MSASFALRLGALIVQARDRGEVRTDADPLAGAIALFAICYMGLVLLFQGTVERSAVEPGLRASIVIAARGLS